MDGFQEGYAYYCKNTGITYAAFQGEAYVKSIVTEIEALTKNLNEIGKEQIQTASDKLKGNVAEFWHSGTFNIDAALKGSKNRTFVDQSKEFASVDISSNFGKNFGLKYYKTGAASAKQQAKSIFERYKEYTANGGKDSLEKFLANRGFTEETVLSDPIYAGQVRVIPSDQMADAIAFLERKIAKESVSRPEEVERYQKTLTMLQDKVKDNKGNESIALTKEEATKLADLAKESAFDPKDFGLTTEELVKYQYILQQAFKAGMSAATISIVLKVAPEIVKAIQYLIINGELDEKQFQKIGFAALSGGAEGFIRGSVAAAITTACKAGLWGAALKSVNPTVIGAITVVAMNTMKNAFAVATGKMESRELADELVREMFISSCSLLMGGFIQGIVAELPVVGFMLGSFVGSVLGSFAYSAGYNAVLSFCVDTGFTMFGLVDQDYKLPEEVVRQIGLPVFEYDKFEYPIFSYPKFSVPYFEHPKSEPDSIGIFFLRRGVIGIRQIGYV